MSRKLGDLVEMWDRLDEAGRISLLDYAQFLAARVPAPSRQKPAPLPGREGESVLEAVRRLNAGYPMLERKRLLRTAAPLLSQHMLDARGAMEVIAELEALYAAEYRALATPNIREP